MPNQVLLSMPIDEFKKIVEDCVKQSVEKIVQKQQFEKLLTTEEVTEMLNVTRVTLYSWREQGLIPYYKVGNRVYFKHSDLMEAMENIRAGKIRKKKRR